MGSRLIDAHGVEWTVLEVERKELIGTFTATCRRLEIEETLDDLATVLHATYTKAAAGDAKPHWKVVAKDVPARFQPMTEEAIVLLGAEDTREMYRVTLAREVPIDLSDDAADLAGGQWRLVDSKGQRYRITQYLNRERIDRLGVCVAVRITEGSEFWDPAEVGEAA